MGLFVSQQSDFERCANKVCGIIKVPEPEVDPDQAEGDVAVEGEQAAPASAADPELEKPAPKFPSPVSAWITPDLIHIFFNDPFIASGFSVCDVSH